MAKKVTKVDTIDGLDIYKLTVNDTVGEEEVDDAAMDVRAPKPEETGGGKNSGAPVRRMSLGGDTE